MDKDTKQHVELINDNIEEFDKQIKQSKQEIVEEATILNCENIIHPYCDSEKSTFIKGAKWQEQRMYSEEEVYNLLYSLSGKVMKDVNFTPVKLEKWFEQFKKK